MKGWQKQMAQTPTEEMKVENGYLVIRRKLTAGVRSASGKNLTVASTGGFVQIPDSDIRVNLIAIKKG
jgi:hypothetical protein